MIVIAHNIRSLHNVGSIFRSCDAFGVEKLYLSGITGVPPRREIAKVALGSEHRVAWEHTDDVLELIRSLQSDGCTIVALENGPRAKPIDAFCPTCPSTCPPQLCERRRKLDNVERSGIGQIAIIVGNEVEGIDREILDVVDATVEIPMPGRKQSLNVSVAAGIALFALMSRAR